MFEVGKEREYFDIGKHALAICIEYVNKPDKDLRILDFPCGYGRVTRYFRDQFPSARIFGCELDSRMLDFCEVHFSIERVQSNDEMEIELPDSLDLIFVGSLLTHYDEHQWDKFFILCERALGGDGKLIFTTHGRIHALMAKESHPLFGDLIDTKVLYSIYKDKGFGYIPYDAKWPTFGLSLSSPEWVMGKISKLQNLKILHMGEGEWGQDVWVLSRVEEGAI